MNMKKLIESMDHIEECGMAEGPMGMAPPAPEMDKGNPVTVNVSMNASGKEHVADLLDMMKNAGLGDAAPAGDAMMSPRMDMERLSGIMGEPADGLDDKAMSLPAPDDIEGSEDESYANEMDGLEDELAADMDEGQFKREMTDDAQQMDLIDFVDKYSDYGEEEASAMWHDMNEEAAADMDMDDEEEDLAADMDMDDEEAETEDMSSEGTYTIKVKGKDMDSQNELARIASLSGVSAPQEMETEAAGDYANEPDEQYSDLSAVIPDGDDLHKKKKSHPATAGGDNPMAIENIKAALYAALTEKKMSEGEVPAGLKAYQAKKGKGKAPAKGKSKSGKMPMDAGKDGKKGTKDDKPAFLKKEEMAAEGRGRGKKTKVMAGRGRGK
jgi:hypothetical protein